VVHSDCQRAAAHARGERRPFVRRPDDVKLLATSVLEHRLVLSSEAMTRGRQRRRRARLDPRDGAGPAAASALADAMITRRGWALVGSAVGLFVAGRILGSCSSRCWRSRALITTR
jgi:hypothetical protein